MASTSSLLKSALSRRKEQSDIQDKLVDFEWQSSAKTVDDFNSYVQHFQQRTAQSANDLSKSITYQTKLRSANRSFTSAEIQRSQIDILEGNGTLQDKQAAIIDLYGLAVGNQDLDLAQNLRQQFDTINVQIQNQAQRGQRLAARMAATRTQEIEETINTMIYGSANKKGVRDPEEFSLASIKEIFETQGNETFNEVVNSPDVRDHINQRRAADGQPPLEGDIGYWDTVRAVYDTIADTYELAIENSRGTSEHHKLQEKYNQFLGQAADGSETSLDVIPGDGKMTYQQVIAAQNAERAGNSLYAVAQIGGKTQMIGPGTSGVTPEGQRELTDYTWGLDASGKYSLISVRETWPEDESKWRARDAQGNEIVLRDEEGKVIQFGDAHSPRNANIAEALSRLGINAREFEGGYLIENPGQIDGLSGGEPINVVVSRDGRLRAVARDRDGVERLYEVNFSGNGLNAREMQAGDVDATTLKPTDPQAIQLTKDLIGERGQTTDVLGFSKTLEVSRQAGTGVNAVALSGLRAGGVTDVLNQVSDFQKVETAKEDLRLQAAKAAEVQLQQAANLQAASAPNLNQTQVPELGLRVAPLPKLPELKVAPVNAPKLGGVQPIKQTQPFLGVQPTRPSAPFLGVR